MNSNLRTAGILALLAGASTPALAKVDVTGDPVLFWNEMLIEGIHGDPTVQSRSYAMVDVALHDAVNATLGSPDHSYLGHVANAGGDTRAAASVAAHDVLVNQNPAQAAAFDAALAQSLALVPDGAAKTRGMATGAAFASAVIARRAGDGATTPKMYFSTGEPGNWRPTPGGPPFGIDLQYADVTPWVMTSTSQFRPGPPPALGSAQYATALNEVKDIGSAASTSRTAGETFDAQFWATDEGPIAFTRAAIDASVAEGKSTIENARLFATLTTGVADASISIFNTKYHYNLWRPVTAIQLADIDGNAATLADPDWSPLLVTPPFPSYASAGTTVNATGFGILELAFGNDIAFCANNSFGERCFANYSSAASDFADSRVWGGIHFRFDVDTGLAIGSDIARFEFDRGAFGAVPEPSSWAMMIAGFGLIGTMRRRATVRAVTA